MEFAFTKYESLYASSSFSTSPSRRGSLSAAFLGFFPPNLGVPSSIAASIAFSIFSMVSVSSFGIISDTEYFSLPP